MSNGKICPEHQRAFQGNCSSCRRALCDGCDIRLSGGKVLCLPCSQSRTPKPASFLSFQSAWQQFKWFQILGIIFIIAAAFLLGIKHPGAAGKGVARMNLLFILSLYLIPYIYFFFRLRCPSCNCYILFYLGDSLWEFFRSKFCPRCGQQLKG